MYSSTRVKLVKCGVRLTSAMFDHIVNHKLLEPLERCLEVADGVRRDTLAEHVRGLLVPGAHYAMLTRNVARGALISAFSNVDLPAPIAFKLTVAREQRPALFAHSLDAAVLAAYLALRRGWGGTGITHAVAAGLLHDLGELHIDPTLLDPRHRLSAEEFEFIYSHPVSAYLIAQAQPGYGPVIRDAVLEHHERLDGSGYPRGLRDGAISELGQLLAAAEVGAVLLRRVQRTGIAAHMEVPIKMMWHKFEPQLITLLRELLPVEAADGDDRVPVDLDGQRQLLQSIADLLVDWGRTQAELDGAGDRLPDDVLLTFVAARVDRLHRALLATGFDPRDVDAFVSVLADDGSLRSELAAIAGEATWAFRDVIHEARRRWDEFETAPEASRAAVDAWLSRAEARLPPIAIR